MESLLSTYASSDDDEPQQKTAFSASKTLSSCLPQPKSSIFNNNLTDPKQSTTLVSSAKALFSALPQPKSQQQQPKQKQPKKIVQIKHPFASSTNPIDDDDDDDDEKEKRRRKEAAQSSLQTSSVKSFFATIPAPRNSGSLGSGLSSGRRAILDTVPTVDGSEPAEAQNLLGGDENVVSYDTGGGCFDSNSAYGGYGAEVDPSSGSYAGYGTYQSGVGVDQNAMAAGDSSGYGYCGNYAEYGSYEYYGNSWGGGSGKVGEEMSSGSGENESALRVLGKRGRKEVPVEIVEVKQDELMKNRPREDQVKLTGIAFGPSYKGWGGHKIISKLSSDEKSLPVLGVHSPYGNGMCIFELSMR